MPQLVPTHINAHKERLAELRAQEAQIKGEADQLLETIKALDPEFRDPSQAEPETEREEPAQEPEKPTESKPAPKEVKPDSKGKK